MTGRHLLHDGARVHQGLFIFYKGLLCKYLMLEMSLHGQIISVIRMQREQAQLLRQQQDQAYLDSLKADQEKVRG